MNINAYQAMPSTGKLVKNLNLRPELLAERLASFGRSIVYFYVVDTVEYHEGRLYQAGSGPNFQGDLLTLCSCKHWMRASLEPDAWEGVWVAGYTGSTDLGSNKLFYLMKVSQAFESHRELWLSDSVACETKTAKASHLDKFGDIYKPNKTTGRPYFHLHYLPPCENHVHCELDDWKKDIRYKSRNASRAALLAGDAEYSFLWDRPLIESPIKIRRGHRKMTIADMFSV